MCLTTAAPCVPLSCGVMHLPTPGKGLPMTLLLLQFYLGMTSAEPLNEQRPLGKDMYPC